MCKQNKVKEWGWKFLLPWRLSEQVGRGQSWVESEEITDSTPGKSSIHCVCVFLHLEPDGVWGCRRWAVAAAGLARTCCTSGPSRGFPAAPHCSGITRKRAQRHSLVYKMTQQHKPLWVCVLVVSFFDPQGCSHSLPQALLRVAQLQHVGLVLGGCELEQLEDLIDQTWHLPVNCTDNWELRVQRASAAMCSGWSRDRTYWDDEATLWSNCSYLQFQYWRSFIFKYANRNI